MDFTSGERLFHILMPWSNIDLFENCSLNREVGMRIERCREDCYDLGDLQAAGEQLSQEILR